MNSSKGCVEHRNCERCQGERESFSFGCGTSDGIHWWRLTAKMSGGRQRLPRYVALSSARSIALLICVCLPSFLGLAPTLSLQARDPIKFSLVCWYHEKIKSQRSGRSQDFASAN